MLKVYRLRLAFLRILQWPPQFQVAHAIVNFQRRKEECFFPPCLWYQREKAFQKVPSRLPTFCCRQNNGLLRYPHLNPWNLWMSWVMCRGELKSQIELRLLSSWAWEAHVILHYLGGQRVITGDLISGRGRWEREKPERRQCKKDLVQYCWLWRWRNGVWAKECRQPLEAGKGKDMDSPPEPLERI